MFSVFKNYHWNIHFKSSKLHLYLFSTFAEKFLPNLDLDYLCNPSNVDEIRNNIRLRKGVGDIDKVLELHEAWIRTSDKEKKDLIKKQLVQAALKIPNKSHPDIASLEDKPIVVHSFGDEVKPQSKALQFHDISQKLNICRTENISNLTGPRSYFFMDNLCSLEQALIRYSLSFLKKLNFELVSVPDILPREVIEYCGMDTRGERHQVYSLGEGSPGDLCLSGTAEIGIAYYLSKRKIISSELPLRLMAVSRCFRAETSKVSEEKGVYRVHQFTKVEMFGATDPSQSDSLLREFVRTQEELFAGLGLCLRTLDMPPPELGAQAARKFDVEAWLPGRQMWGELSSASNCTDYQSRRLGIRGPGGYLHTVNGTACAVPRLALALLETHAHRDSLTLPAVLSEYLDTDFAKKSRIPDLTPFKSKVRFA